MKKISLVLILCLILSFGMSIVVSAEEYNINPRLNNAMSCERYFYISNDIAWARIEINSQNGVVPRTMVKVTIEKRALLGLWWKEEASWEASTTETNPVIEFSKEVKSGTYRCNFEITIEGTGGSADVITDQITATN